tara:strand:+ start:538 stop:729 length:192 start_codon:yes stop_codon:yes gene_type:complete
MKLMTKEPRSKAMTLKLTETHYRQLKRYGFKHDLSSQAILEDLVIGFLNRVSATASEKKKWTI